MPEKIVACLMVRNEEGRVGRAIRSVLPLVDSVVVADTGSVDGTVEEVLSCGVTPMHLEWPDNFAEARNAILTNIPDGTWVLSLDGDEVLTERTPGSLRAAVESRKADAYVLEKRSYVQEPRGFGYRQCVGEYAEEMGYPGYLIEPNDLLFRKEPDVFWHGAVHETVGQSLLSRGGRRESLSTVVLHNYGRLKPVDNTEMYSRLVDKRLADYPSDPVAMYYKALYTASAGDVGLAEELYTRSLAIERRDSAIYGLASIRLKTGKDKLAETGFVEFLRMRPEESTAWMGLLAACLAQEDQEKVDYYAAWAQRSGRCSRDVLKFAAYCSEKLGNTAIRDYYITRYDET
jgi:glycosyltransferase involved in cell wall biosynthesis